MTNFVHSHPRLYRVTQQWISSVIDARWPKCESHSPHFTIDELSKSIEADANVTTALDWLQALFEKIFTRYFQNQQCNNDTITVDKGIESFLQEWKSAMCNPEYVDDITVTVSSPNEGDPLMESLRKYQLNVENVKTFIQQQIERNSETYSFAEVGTANYHVEWRSLAERQRFESSLQSMHDNLELLNRFITVLAPTDVSDDVKEKRRAMLSSKQLWVDLSKIHEILIVNPSIEKPTIDNVETNAVHVKQEVEINEKLKKVDEIEVKKKDIVTNAILNANQRHVISHTIPSPSLSHQSQMREEKIVDLSSDTIVKDSSIISKDNHMILASRQSLGRSNTSSTPARSTADARILSASISKEQHILVDLTEDDGFADQRSDTVEVVVLEDVEARKLEKQSHDLNPLLIKTKFLDTSKPSTMPSKDSNEPMHSISNADCISSPSHSAPLIAEHTTKINFDTADVPIRESAHLQIPSRLSSEVPSSNARYIQDNQLLEAKREFRRLLEEKLKQRRNGANQLHEESRDSNGPVSTKVNCLRILEERALAIAEMMNTEEFQQAQSNRSSSRLIPLLEPPPHHQEEKSVRQQEEMQIVDNEEPQDMVLHVPEDDKESVSALKETYVDAAAAIEEEVISGTNKVESGENYHHVNVGGEDQIPIEDVQLQNTDSSDNGVVNNSSNLSVLTDPNALLKLLQRDVSITPVKDLKENGSDSDDDDYVFITKSQEQTTLPLKSPLFASSVLPAYRRLSLTIAQNQKAIAAASTSTTTNASESISPNIVPNLTGEKEIASGRGSDLVHSEEHATISMPEASTSSISSPPTSSVSAAVITPVLQDIQHCLERTMRTLMTLNNSDIYDSKETDELIRLQRAFWQAESLCKELQIVRSGGSSTDHTRNEKRGRSDSNGGSSRKRGRRSEEGESSDDSAIRSLSSRPIPSTIIPHPLPSSKVQAKNASPSDVMFSTR